MLFCFLLQIYRVTEPIGIIHYIPSFSCEKIPSILNSSEKTVFFIGNDRSTFSFANFGILKYKNTVKFIYINDSIECSDICESTPCMAAYHQDRQIMTEYRIGNSPEFIDWMRYISNPVQSRVTNLEEFRRIFSTNRDSLLAVDIDEIDYEIPDDIQLLHVPLEYFTYIDFSLIPGLYYYRFLDREIIPYEGNLKAIRNLSIKSLNSPDLLTKPYVAGFVIEPENDLYLQTSYMYLNDLAHIYDQVNFVNFVGKESHTFVEKGNLGNFEAPFFVIFNSSHISSGRWILTQNYSMMSNISIFQDYIERVVSGKEPFTVYSKELPEQNESLGIQEINAKTFHEKVMNEKFDVFVAFTAPWCHHCNTLKPVMNETGELFAHTPIKFYHFDATENDYPHSIPSIDGYPTVFYFPSGSKSEPIEYDEERSINGFVSFIRNHTKLKFNDPEIPTE